MVSKSSVKPPRPADPKADEKKAYKEEPEKRRRKPAKKNIYPWQEESVDERIPKAWTVRMPMTLHCKVAYIAENATPRTSMQKIMLEGIEAIVEKYLEDLEVPEQDR